MSKSKKLIVILLFFALQMLFSIKCNAELKPISYFIKDSHCCYEWEADKRIHVYCSGKLREDYDPIDDYCSQKGIELPGWTWNSEGFRLQAVFYNLSGKSIKSLELGNSGGVGLSFFNSNKKKIVLKSSAKKPRVYYYKIRLLYNDKENDLGKFAVSEWSKPIYFWLGGKKAFKVKVSGINDKRIKTIKMKTPKCKGIKKYVISIRYGCLGGQSEKMKIKTVKAGKTVLFKNAIIDKDNLKKIYHFPVAKFRITPIFKNKSDGVCDKSPTSLDWFNNDTILRQLYVRKK